MKDLLSSGLYRFWEKWDLIKFPREDKGISLAVTNRVPGTELNPQNDEDHDDGDELTTFKPLSFRDSDIYLIFYAFLLLLLGSCLALFIELLSDLFEIVEY